MTVNVPKETSMTNAENKSLDEREFDGRANFSADDNIETLLDAHFEKYNISKQGNVKKWTKKNK